MFEEPHPPALPPAPPAPTEPDAGTGGEDATSNDAESRSEAPADALSQAQQPAPVDSLLIGPCPLEGEAASACLHEMERPPDKVRLAQVIIAWKGTLPGAPPHRDEQAARKLALELGHVARRKGMAFSTLIHKYSDEPGDGVYTIDNSAEGRFLPGIITVARRLGLGSVDVIKTRFGFHVVKRMAPSFTPKPRPLPELVGGVCPEQGEESARCGIDRPPKPGFKAPKQTVVAHVLVAYKGAMGRRRVARDRSAALALAVRLAHAARRAGADFSALAQRYSDDPGDGRYEVSAGSKLMPPFRTMALRLPLGGVDVVETRYGFHVMRRMK